MPFFMFLGVAGQLLGLMFFFFFLLNNSKSKDFLKISFLFLLLWLVFPLWNLGHFFFGRGGELTVSQLFSSHTPSSSLVMSLGCCLVFFWSKESHKSFCSEKFFFLGLLCALFFLAIYVVFQYFFGFDYRYDNFRLPDQDRFNGTYFRAYGLYGHPLSLSSVMLAILGYSCVLLEGARENKKKLIFICLLSFIILLLTGSRAPALIACFFLFVFFARKLPIFFLLFGIVTAFIAFYYIGIFSRVLELFSLKNISDFPRFVFWKVHAEMFFDSPVFGHGYAAVSNFLRYEYYDLAGLSDFLTKYSAHNIYLEFLVELGLFGSFLVGSILFFLLFFLKKNAKSPLFFYAFLVALGLNMIHGLTQNTFFDANLFSPYLYLYVLSATT